MQIDRIELVEVSAILMSDAEDPAHRHGLLLRGHRGSG